MVPPEQNLPTQNIPTLPASNIKRRNWLARKIHKSRNWTARVPVPAMNAGGRNLRKRKTPPPEPARRGRKKQQRSRGGAATRSRARHEPEPEPEVKREEEEVEVEVEEKVEEEEGEEEEVDEADDDEEPEADEIAVEEPSFAGVPKIAVSRRNAPGRSLTQSIVDMTFNRSEVSGDFPLTQRSLMPSEGESSQRRSLRLNIHQLEKLASELMTSLEHSAQDGSFLVPRAAFEGARRLFPKVQGLSQPSPFIDPDGFVNVEPSPLTGASAVDIVHRVNLVTALDIISQLFEDPMKSRHDEILRPIAALDDYLYELVFPFGDEAARVNFAFDLRVVRALEMLPGDGQLSRAGVLSTFNSVFCLEPESLSQDSPEKQDLLKAMTEGPYRELCHRSQDDVEVLCGRRLVDIVKRIFRNRPPTVREVQKDYKMRTVFEKLVDWLSKLYFDSDPQREEGADEGEKRTIRHRDYVNPFVAEDADFATQISQQLYGDEEASIASQPIVRLSDADPSRATMYDRNALAALQDDSQADGYSGSYTIRSPRRPRKSVYDHENADILGQRPSETNGSPAASSPHATSRRQPRRSQGRRKAEEEEDDEDDNPFEEDTRPPDPRRRAMVNSNLARNRSPLPRSARPSSAPRQRYPSPPTATPVLHQAPPPSSFAAMQLEKRNLKLSRAALTSTPTIRQRYPWSDNDSQTLVDLINLRHAAWSTIETCDGERFEHPRNQQAYRDKARNMKVDMLLTDAVLPPKFDLVTLGKKEIDRVISFGKNPLRKERDIDEYGRAINTEHEGE